MITPRRSKDRGFVDHGWLRTFHTFSFSTYYDHHFMGFSALRVINEDRVQGAQGFDPHSHKDMEIITYVIEGALAHKDSMGNGSVIVPDDVQYMSAGSGVTHSEFNHSETEDAHFLQIWIIPEKRGTKPRYGQKKFTREQKLGRLCMVVSPDGAEDSIAVHQEARLFASVLTRDQTTSHTLADKRRAWLQVVKGEILLNGDAFVAGDGAMITDEFTLSIRGITSENEFLLFDLP